MARHNVLKSCDKLECALLTINWTDCDFAVRGAGGHPGDLLTPAQVLRALQKMPPRNTSYVGVAIWETADGVLQLCFYDRQQWENEVYGPGAKQRHPRQAKSRSP